MGFFSLLAGYHTASSLLAKGARPFMGRRLLRLGPPLRLFGLVLGPVTVALAAVARGQPFTETLLRLWGRGVCELGPLWFVWALLLLLALATLPLGRWLVAVRPVPSDRTLLAAALCVGAAALALRRLL